MRSGKRKLAVSQPLTSSQPLTASQPLFIVQTLSNLTVCRPARGGLLLFSTILSITPSSLSRLLTQLWIFHTILQCKAHDLMGTKGSIDRYGLITRNRRLRHMAMQMSTGMFSFHYPCLSVSSVVNCGWNHKEPLIARMSTDCADIFSFHFLCLSVFICVICG
jgi:hypothetical protein